MSAICNNRAYIAHCHKVLFIPKHLDKSGFDGFIEDFVFFFLDINQVLNGIQLIANKILIEQNRCAMACLGCGAVLRY